MRHQVLLPLGLGTLAVTGSVAFPLPNRVHSGLSSEFGDPVSNRPHPTMRPEGGGNHG